MSHRIAANGGRILAAYWAVIFALTHTPVAPGVLPSGWMLDKPIHAGMYAGLAFFLVRYIRQVFTFGSGARFAACLFIVAVYAALDEWSQGFVGRTPSLGDVGADLLGGSCGLIVGNWMATADPVGRARR